MKEFTLTNSAGEIVKQQYYRIKTLFPEVNINFDKQSDVVSSVWVYVTGPTEELCETAKKFITALTTPSSHGTMQIPLDFQNLLLKNNRQILTEIERQNPAVIDLDIQTQQIALSGEEIDIVLARSLIEDRLNSFKTKNQSIEISSITDCFGGISIDDNVKAFALKLGYDTSDILAAVKSCTSNKLDVNEDTLLKELMKLKQPEKLTNQISDIVQEEDKFVSSVARSVAESTKEQLSSDSSNMLRGIVIDGSNVAMCHGHKAVFSCIGIEIVINWCKKRGHTNIVTFVPQWRQEASKPDCPIKNQEILHKLEQQKNLVFTPSRRINGRRVVCYDDRYIVKYAVETNSIIISNDNFRDLQKENPKWKQFLDEHILMYSFVNDLFMPPDDPLGRSGPNLSDFLRKGIYQTRVCPYRSKCTYGNKCKFYHPENSNYLPTMSVQGSTDSFDTMQRTSQCNSNEAPLYPQYNSTLSSMSRQSHQLPMSCAAEMNAYEQQGNYQFHDSDILAKGGEMRPHSSSNGPEHQNADPNRNIREWNAQRSQVYPSLNYYQSQYALPPKTQQQQQQQQQRPISQNQNHSTQQYYLRQQNGQMPTHWNGQTYGSNQTYTTTNSPHTTNQQYVLQPMLHNQTPQHLNMMPGCVDPRAMNQQYFKPTMSHTLQSIETSKIRDTQDRMYLQERCRPSGVVDTNSVIFRQLSEFFPGRGNTIRKVLIENPSERDLNVLAQKVMQEN